jgi:hypothetical protein
MKKRNINYFNYYAIYRLLIGGIDNTNIFSKSGSIIIFDYT